MSLVKKARKIMGEGYGDVASNGIMGDVAGYIDSGCYLLNAQISGSMFKGFPSNKIATLSGDPSTGKTFFALQTVAAFLEADPEREVVVFDTENAWTTKMMKKKGIDLSRVFVENIMTVKEFSSKMLKLLDDIKNDTDSDGNPNMHGKVLFVLDSIGQLSTSKEMADTQDGKDTRDMTRAQELKGAFRTTTNKMGVLNIAMICTNHVYDEIGTWSPTGKPPKKAGGGTGSVYAATTSLYLSKKKERDTKTKEHIGHILVCETKKGRDVVEGSKIQCQLLHKGGLSRYYGLLDEAIEAGIVKQGGSWYTFPDGEKIQKRENVMADIERLFTPDVMKQLDNHLANKFTYGTGENDDVDTNKD